MPRKLTVTDVPEVVGTGYPPPHDAPCQTRGRRRLGPELGLTQFGVNQVRLPPGAWSSQRHWHTHEDEWVYVLEGELTLVTDAGAEALRAGDCAGFPAGVRDGHHLQNRSDRDAVYLEVGTRHPDDQGEYPDIDMVFVPGRSGGETPFRRRDGTSF